MALSMNPAQTPKVVSAYFNPSQKTELRPTGVYQLIGDAIPVGAIITRAWYQVLTTFTSAGADAGTIAISLPGATGDAVAAIAISDVSNPWDAGLHMSAVTVPGTGITTPVVGGAAHITVTTAVQALTAGNMVIFVEYVQGD